MNPDHVIHIGLESDPELDDTTVMVSSSNDPTYVFNLLRSYYYEKPMDFNLDLPKSKRVGPDYTPSLYSVGRNEMCPCGSGLKHKKCCINKKK